MELSGELIPSRIVGTLYCDSRSWVLVNTPLVTVKSAVKDH